MDTDEPDPPRLTVADIADIERRADIATAIKPGGQLINDLRRLLAELKRIHAKVHDRAAVIEGTHVDDAELAAIRTTYENHLARGNYVHPMAHDVGRLLGEVDRLRKRHQRPVPDWFFGGSRVPVDMSTDARWHAVAAAASGLLVHIDATPYAYPEPGQDTGDFARDQLAEAAAAAIWALLAHAVTTGDDHHFDTFTAALINADRIPENIAAVIGPAFADLITAAYPHLVAAVNASTNPPDEPEGTS